MVLVCNVEAEIKEEEGGMEEGYYLSSSRVVCAKKKRANQMNKGPLEVDGRAAEDGGPYC